MGHPSTKPSISAFSSSYSIYSHLFSAPPLWVIFTSFKRASTAMALFTISVFAVVFFPPPIISFIVAFSIVAVVSVVFACIFTVLFAFVFVVTVPFVVVNRFFEV